MIPCLLYLMMYTSEQLYKSHTNRSYADKAKIYCKPRNMFPKSAGHCLSKVVSVLIALRDTMLFITGCNFTLNTKMTRGKEIQRLIDWRSCCSLSSCPKGCITKPHGFMDMDSYVILFNISYPKATCHFYFVFIKWKRVFALICFE